MVYAIAFPLASVLEDLYSFTCCPDSSVVERHLGKMEVPGSIPGRGSDKPVSSEAGFFVSLALHCKVHMHRSARGGGGLDNACAHARRLWGGLSHFNVRAVRLDASNSPGNPPEDRVPARY